MEEFGLVNSYIMGKVDPGSESSVRQEILKLKGVRKVSVVYGDVDLVTEVKVNDLIELRELNDDIRRIKGVLKTTTYLVKKEP